VITRNVILHSHIFKNAGSTFDWSLKRNFGERFVDHRDDEAMLSGKMEHLDQFLSGHPQVVALSSHRIHFRVSGWNQLRFHVVRILRDPIERARSVYNFDRQRSFHLNSLSRGICALNPRQRSATARFCIVPGWGCCTRLRHPFTLHSNLSNRRP
jgi:hypothetical protein